MFLGWLETIVTAIGDGSRFGLAVRYSMEGPGALETLGGIRQVLPWLGEEPFWVVNGDVYSDFAFPSAFAQLPAGTRGRLLLAENPPHNVRGDFALRGDRVVRAETRPYTYTGIACFDPALFADQPPGKAALGPLLFQAADSGVLTGTVHRGRWDDVGTLERLAELRDWQAAQPDD